MRVWCKKSVAYATEILQIFKKIKQIGNKLPENLAQITRIARKVFQLTIDNWQMWWARIGNCVAGFHRLQYKYSCKSVLYITEIN